MTVDPMGGPVAQATQIPTPPAPSSAGLSRGAEASGASFWGFSALKTGMLYIVKETNDNATLSFVVIHRQARRLEPIILA